MKKTFILLAFAVCLPFLILAQKVEVTPFAGYVFGGTLQAEGGDVYINDNAQYGGMISFAVSRVIDIDLLYNRSDTKAEVNVYSGYNSLSYGEVPLSINYMHVGFTKNFRTSPRVSPYLGLNLGACVFAPKEDYADAWFFSMGFNGGVKIYLSNRIGIRLQAQGMIPFQGAGFTMFAGTGGSGGGVSVYSTLFQVGFTGGLIFRLGHIQSAQ